MTNRRTFLATLGASAAAVSFRGSAQGVPASAAGSATAAGSPASPRRVPFIHTTDLYHPPQDPDDHVDLATLYALPELDLRAIVLDPARKFTPQLDPGFVPVAQLNYLTGRAIPAAAGPLDPLRSLTDTATDRPRNEQTGIQLLLDTLRHCEEPAIISVAGSVRVVAAAWNREPDLLRRKVRAILLNAGGSVPAGPLEWNVTLDPWAYTALFRSGLPLEWYPCSGEKGPFDSAAHNTFWRISHRELFGNLPRPLAAWFEYALTGNTQSAIIRALASLGQGPAWEKVLTGDRNMWCMASFALAAGRALCQTAEGWRFVPRDQAAGTKQQPLETISVVCEADDRGVVSWTRTAKSTPVRLFQRVPGEDHTHAMCQATNALLRSLPVA